MLPVLPLELSLIVFGLLVPAASRQCCATSDQPLRAAYSSGVQPAGSCAVNASVLPPLAFAACSHAAVAAPWS